MSRQRYPEEFKIEAVKQVTEKGKPVADVAQRLGMSVHSLYAWIKVYTKPQEQRQQDDDQQAELRKLRAELKRVTEERDILKKAPHRVISRVLLDEGVLQPHSLAKYAAAFFKMSRSSVTRLSSARSLRSSAC